MRHYVTHTIDSMIHGIVTHGDNDDRFMWAVGSPLLPCSVTICNFYMMTAGFVQIVFLCEIIKQGASNHPGCSFHQLFCFCLDTRAKAQSHPLLTS